MSVLMDCKCHFKAILFIQAFWKNCVWLYKYLYIGIDMYFTDPGILLRKYADLNFLITHCKNTMLTKYRLCKSQKGPVPSPCSVTTHILEHQIPFQWQHVQEDNKNNSINFKIFSKNRKGSSFITLAPGK